MRFYRFKIDLVVILCFCQPLQHLFLSLYILWMRCTHLVFISYWSFFILHLCFSISDNNAKDGTISDNMENIFARIMSIFDHLSSKWISSLIPLWHHWQIISFMGIFLNLPSSRNILLLPILISIKLWIAHLPKSLAKIFQFR